MSFDDIYKSFEKEAKFWLEELEKYNDVPFSEQSHDEEWTLAKLYSYLYSVCVNFYCTSIRESIKEEKIIKGRKNFIGVKTFMNGKISKHSLKKFNKSFVPKHEALTVNEAKSKILLSMKSMFNLRTELKSVDAKQKIKHPIFGTLSLKNMYQLPELHFQAMEFIKDDIEAYIVSRKGVSSGEKSKSESDS